MPNHFQSVSAVVVQQAMRLPITFAAKSIYFSFYIVILASTTNATVSASIHCAFNHAEKHLKLIYMFLYSLGGTVAGQIHHKTHCKDLMSMNPLSASLLKVAQEIESLYECSLIAS